MDTFTPTFDQRTAYTFDDSKGPLLPATTRLLQEPPTHYRATMGRKSRFLEIVLVARGFIRGDGVNAAGKALVSRLAKEQGLKDWKQAETTADLDALIAAVRGHLTFTEKGFTLVGEPYSSPYPLQLPFITKLPPDATLEEAICRVTQAGFQLHVHSHPTYGHLREKDKPAYSFEIRGDCYSHDSFLSVYMRGFEVTAGWQSGTLARSGAGDSYMDAPNTIFGGVRNLIETFNEWIDEVEEKRIARERAKEFALTPEPPKRKGKR